MYNKKKTDIFCAVICYGFKIDASANICVQFSDLIVYKALLIFTVHLIYPDVKEAQCSFSTCLLFFNCVTNSSIFGMFRCLVL